MLGILSSAEVENMLHEEHIVRIGCHSNGHTYVVPVMYWYDGEAVVGYSPEGRKIIIMRENPNVCVEIDRVDDLVTWRSVIASGKYHELSGPAADTALSHLQAHLRPMLPNALATPGHGLDEHTRALNRKRTVVFRIVLGHKSGRFEVQALPPITPPPH